MHPHAGKRNGVLTAEDHRTCLGALRDLGQDLGLLSQSYKALIETQTRHGSLQVMLSALERCRSSIKMLVRSEEYPEGKTK